MKNYDLVEILQWITAIVLIGAIAFVMVYLFKINDDHSRFLMSECLKNYNPAECRILTYGR